MKYYHRVLAIKWQFLSGLCCSGDIAKYGHDVDFLFKKLMLDLLDLIVMFPV